VKLIIVYGDYSTAIFKIYLSATKQRKLEPQRDAY